MVTAVAEDDPELIARYETVGRRFSGIVVAPDPVALRCLVDLADAHRLLDDCHLQGKLVLTV